MEEEKSVLDNVRYWLEKRGFALESLARAIHVNPVTIYRWKESIPRADILFRVAFALCVEPQDLMEDVEIGDVDRKELYL